MRTSLGVSLVLSLAVGCSCNEAPDDPDSAGRDGGGADAAGDDAGAFDAGAFDAGVDARTPADAGCVDFGRACTDDSDCCGGSCAPDGVGTFICTLPPICGPEGTACAFSVDCCEGGCAGGACDSAASCASVGQACAVDADCCSASCEAGLCTPGAGGCRSAGTACTDGHGCCSGTCSMTPLSCQGDGPACGVAGESCTSDTGCCSRSCDGSRCERLTFCRPAGEPCTTSDECCGLLCRGGYCDAPLYCRATFETCDNSGECCTFRCDRTSGGPTRCLPIGGCRTSGYHQTTMSGDVSNEWGELCTRDEECCSGRCEADPEGVLRCRKRMGHPGQNQPEPICLPAGELCENDAHCCSGRCIQLRPDPPVGPQFPKRCTDLDCDPIGDPSCCFGDGQVCADPAECCGGICLLHPDGAYRCGTPPTDPPPDAGTPGVDGGRPPMCVPRGGDCTTDSDCCAGYSCLPFGARRLCEVGLI